MSRSSTDCWVWWNSSSWIYFLEMHSLPNSSAVRRFRFAALLLLVKWLLVIVSVVFVGYLVIAERKDLSYIVINLMGITLLISVSHWVVSLRARCPLCLVPSFSHQQCSKSRDVRNLLGNYRLFVALDVLCKGSFRCPYCGESTAIRVRQRNRGTRR